LYRHGNWDVVNNSIVWDPTNPDHNLPASLAFASKPDWFGDRPWPAYDPANPSAAVVTNIPAGYRFVFGVDPPSSRSGNQPPIVAANASPKTGVAPLTVTFSSAGSSDPEGAPLTYSWTFGDGSTSTSANPTHVYANVGSYSAYLTVSDGTNSTTSASIGLTVTLVASNAPPVASASATPSGGVAPLTVAFSSAGSSDPEGATLTYNWQFGDGATSTSANPSHTYVNSGNYLAQLTVSDGTNTSAPSQVSINVANAATGGLVAAYGFEEGTGSTVGDGSGQGNTGTINGAAWAKGRFGNGLSFNGSGAMVTINDAASLDVTSGLTLEAWVNATSLPTGWHDIVFKSGDVYFLMGTTPQGAPDLGGVFATTNVFGSGALPLNTWTHLAGTYDGATMKFYVNGVLVSSRAQTGAITTSTGPLSIGGDAGGQYWNGSIDEVRVYNRALSQVEIHDDMNTPVVGTSTSPAAPTNNRVIAHTP
jgi:PKD repeat protein